MNILVCIGSSCHLRGSYDIIQRLKELSAGDTVIFTDMDGVVNTYCVERLETVEPDAVDSVLNSGCDLVLYTCTKGGKTRVTAFCDRADRESSDG